ncbi:protein-L-isoaspartate(D-aspartate) O-methyltransferase [Pelagibius litoralis]|uniref:Protein-L-isoaspartate O-methyltransferase n=1 Tax=Pelagibius litoralis TaxID=374515 RepID=A0A967KBH7_9PROT|nr:protein-L-isoaspartate(D-aspartate) O-methyltransferase [Pelagibius litoralis]NIA71097.1 protein-L-isoaspartate(D-aspartate) O-methyltransferase [Pelagibius litoralis]
MTDHHATVRQAERAAMVEAVVAEAAEAADWLGDEPLDGKVLQALAKVPRHAFVPGRQAAAAYENQPLPIGGRQTISQPFIVAVMSDQAEITAGSRVLEVGTGSGYQAAMLAELGAEVFTLEVLPGLAAEAAAKLAHLGYDRVHCRQGDGAAGWPEAAPFDAILVTAAADRVPGVLLDQLAPGGRMIIPLEEQDTATPAHWRRPRQTLVRIDKAADGSLSEKALLPVAFVPLTGPSAARK